MENFKKQSNLSKGNRIPLIVLLCAGIYFVSYLSRLSFTAVTAEIILAEGFSEEIIAIVLHMQETAGNEYMGLSAGDGFTVQLLAKQKVSESDSFGPNYDKDSEYDGLPMALVSKAPQFVGEGKIADADWNSMGNVNPASNNVVPLETAYTFTAPETYEEAQKSEYAKWHADFVVSVDADVPANSVMIAGNYGTYGWVGFTNDGEAIAEGTEVRLLDLAGISMNYEELCNFVQTFSCGAADYRDALAGATMTVELRLYEVERPSAENGNSWNVETEKYEVIGKYSYTFEGPEENPMALVTAFTAQEVADVQTKVDNNDGAMILSGVYDLPTVATEDVEVKALYSFVANDTAATIDENEYKDWKVDFAVVFNKDVPAGAIGLLGEYGTYGWVGFGIPDVNDADSVNGVAAEDSVLVLETACDILGFSPNNWTYKDICEQVGEFNCGVFVNAAMADQIADGTTVTVELRLYNPVNPEMYVVANYVVYNF